MSGFLSWLKSNIVIVILGILTVVPLPVAWYIAGGMNKQLREERQTEATKALRDVEGATVTYTLPVLGENEEEISDSGPANSVKTAFYKVEREKREQLVSQVKERAVEFNAKNHSALVPGLLPMPERGAPAQLLPFEMAKRVQATGGDNATSAYDELFRRLRIRSPLDSEVLREQIAARKQALMTQIAPGIGESEMEESARKQISQQLVEQRLGALETHARDTSFYADESALPPAVPTTVPTVAPSVETCFNWQADYWLVSDLLTAFAAANDQFDTRGVGGNVIDGVVKRVESIQFKPMIDAAAAQTAGMPVEMRDPEPMGGHGRDYAAASNTSPIRRGSADANSVVTGESFTGRGTEPNELYDVRTVKVTLIASYKKLPSLINAISSENFMTVLDADIYSIDPWDLISQGYYIGTDYPVRVEMEIETLWLRSWTKAYMPPAVREQLGIPEDVSTEEGPA
ncbi:MAG: hypothetical protein KDA31_13930 [Phycisphaerales bacterium]|nr:hypothetical protein [Phycisphaerales bacterium]MCB9837605.1 hypothetical protein [Phycisphaera sp.]